MKIWCAVSGHGYGHFAQVAPVVNELARRVPELEVCIAGTLPQNLLAKRLHCRYQQVVRPQDVGLVQPDPLCVDRKATSEALAQLHARWEDRVHAEAQAIAAWSPDFMLADVPYLAIAAAARLDLPTFALASLSWDQVLRAYFPIAQEPAQSWWTEMRSAYALTKMTILPEPAIASDTFPNTIAVPPIVGPGTRRQNELRSTLAIRPDDTRPLVLVSLGGIPNRDLPIEALMEEQGYLWLVDGKGLPPAPHLFELSTALPNWDFVDVLASVDMAVSKPGYNTAVESVANGIPLLYVRRGEFPDEDPICQWLARHGRALEIPRTAFHAGTWRDYLEELQRQPLPATINLDGASQAAEVVLTALSP